MGDTSLAARQCLPYAMPGVSLSRQYRVLKQLSSGIGPRPHLLAGGWLVTQWLEGTPCGNNIPVADLASLLWRLHRQPCFGWRISLRPLLEHYWLTASPRRRSLLWLRTLHELSRRGEPRVINPVPLHMDVHGDNLIMTPDGLRLIDWEYAGDGDAALELAAAEPAQGLIEEYAAQAHLPPDRLASQVRRWRPWVRLLAASWYEKRFQQTAQKQFSQLADEAWRRLRFRE